MVVFEEFLGLDYSYSINESEWVSLECEGQYLKMPLLFPSIGAVSWLEPESLPVLPLQIMAPDAIGLVERSPLPILFGGGQIVICANEIQLGIDLWGTFFFMLSRYEEILHYGRDVHDRFLGIDSLAYKAGFLNRPIVDEYVELLWTCMLRLWPGLQRQRRTGRVFVTCDVDLPYDSAVKNPATLARRIAGDMVRTGSVKEPLKRMRNWISTRRGDYRFDPYDTFDWYLNACERAGRQSAFYFIAERSVLNAYYDVTEPRIQALLRTLNGRGHEIGLHGSYDSYRSAERLKRERQRLLAACAMAGVDTPIAGNRQHYLRWAADETPDHLDAAGFEYDTTGSYADLPGFRYGTAIAFTMWSWKKNAHLKIRQRPLIVMETSVIATAYMGLGYTHTSINLMESLKRKALAHGGDFVLLWHNSHLTTSEDREFFTQLIGP